MPPKQTDRKKSSKSTPKSKSQPQRRQPSKQPSNKPRTNNDKPDQAEHSSIDFSTPIPISLQQLVLDVFKTALLPSNPNPNPNPNPASSTSEATNLTPDPDPSTSQDKELDTKTLIQTIKTHLYQRDFDSAFTDAGEDLLRAYALRWSAARALGYAGLFRAVLRWMMVGDGGVSQSQSQSQLESENENEMLVPERRTRVVCVGGGAGAEIVALAAAWRCLVQEQEHQRGVGETELESLSLGERGEEQEADGKVKARAAAGIGSSSGLSVAAVDIADWSDVVGRLEKTIASSAVPTLRSSEYQPPLVRQDEEGARSSGVSISFRRADVLDIPEDDLKSVLLDSTCSNSLLVTLMFTLNELFSTSMAKATGFLLRMTEILPSNAVLLVVDSPGSYSTLKMGKDKDGAPVERNYPMKFLLDHTLLSVAEGKWERIYTQDSRWWRRDAERLRYQVGEGAGLEDMRFQLHLYRRL